MEASTTFLYDLIDHFSKEYPCFFIKNVIINDIGKEQKIYERTVIFGSLQTDGGKKFKTDGEKISEEAYTLYTKDLVKLNKDDYVLFNNNNLLVVNDIERWDEYGVRIYSLTRVGLEERRLIDELSKLNPESFTTINK